MSIEVGNEDVPTYSVGNRDRFHYMRGRQERRQSDVKMCNELIALFVILFCSPANTGPSLWR